MKKKKVVSQRIYIPTQWHQTGRWDNDGEWIPSVKVITVDRTPVTREWTSVGSGTTETKKESIEVESQESIGFTVGITATATIPDELSSTFLYNYNGKTLAQVMDADVRGFIQNILTSEFGIRPLSKCQADRKDIYEKMRKETTEHFLKLGVKITNLGAAGQFNYIDGSIQESINKKFQSEMDIKSAQNQVEAAQKFAAAQAAVTAKNQLDADINIKNAIADGIRSGKLPVPNVLAGSGVSVLDLYGLKQLANTKK